MVRDGRKHLVLTIHKVSDVIDGGEFARWRPVTIPDRINAVEMHRITWPQMGSFIRREVGAMLDPAATMPAAVQLVLQEESAACRTFGRVGMGSQNGRMRERTVNRPTLSDQVALASG
jgi:hypothetical protein